MVGIGDKVGGFGSCRDGLEIIRRARSEKKELVTVEEWSHYDYTTNENPPGSHLIPFYKENL